MINNPFHPGVFLQELLEEMHITPYRLAKDTFMPATRVGDIIKARRSITPDTALRLAKYFNTSPDYWASPQSSYDLSQCHPEHLDAIRAIA
ncbi:MAG: addiction module antidote protein, HigA family [Cycloclasticus sp.]|nr:MAG: addiction module antidote protein, HigA family [Cycloclasticus sp.]